MAGAYVDETAFVGGPPTLTVAPGGRQSSPSSPSRLSGLNVQATHGLVGIVLVAVVALLVLDKAGFRFAIAVGKG